MSIRPIAFVDMALDRTERAATEGEHLMSTRSNVITNGPAPFVSGQRTPPRPRVWTAGLAAGAAGAVATSLAVAIAHALGDEVAVGGTRIPISGFAMFTLIGALCGIALATLAQRARRPRTVFLRLTASLAALSVIPDLLVDAHWSSRLMLVITHVIAAAIIIPSLAQRLDA
jgi:hypothetical protein